MNKPEALSKFQEQASEKWNAFPPETKRLIVIAALVLCVLIVYTVFNSVNKKIDTQLAETEKYRAALNYIADNQAAYKINSEKKTAMREKLLSADSKVVSKLTSMASSLGFDVTVTPKDPHKLSDDFGAEEQEIEVTLKNVDYTKFIEYLVQIDNLETPIYMRHLNMTRTGVSTAETKMTGSITLISLRLKE